MEPDLGLIVCYSPLRYKQSHIDLRMGTLA
jgi:hypothetical protein